jgi:hypothetical protein
MRWRWFGKEQESLRDPFPHFQSVSSVLASGKSLPFRSREREGTRKIAQLTQIFGIRGPEFGLIHGNSPFCDAASPDSFLESRWLAYGGSMCDELLLARSQKWRNSNCPRSPTRLHARDGGPSRRLYLIRSSTPFAAELRSSVGKLFTKSLSLGLAVISSFGGSAGGNQYPLFAASIDNANSACSRPSSIY